MRFLVHLIRPISCKLFHSFLKIAFCCHAMSRGNRWVMEFTDRGVRISTQSEEVVIPNTYLLVCCGSAILSASFYVLRSIVDGLSRHVCLVKGCQILNSKVFSPDRINTTQFLFSRSAFLRLKFLGFGKFRRVTQLIDLADCFRNYPFVGQEKSSSNPNSDNYRRDSVLVERPSCGFEPRPG